MAQLLVIVALLSLLAACTTSTPFIASFSGPFSGEPAQIVAGGDPERGAAAIQSYGCGGCHRIPGIAGADALVGPPLDSWAERNFIAGSLPNEPQFLIQWIQYPQAIEPGNAMPNMGVTEQDARDISAYLYSLTRN